MNDHSHFHERLEAHDDIAINPSSNPPLADLINPARRNVLKGGLTLAALGFFGGGLAACAKATASPLLGFKGVPVQLDPQFDRVLVAEGYRAVPFFSWGDPVEAGAPAWNPDASDDWQAQLKQAGDNHDGMNFFPFAGETDRGLLVMNHEYVNPPLHPSGKIDQSQPRPLAGHAVMKTASDPAGLEVLGTLNNCATGVTPWGTFLTCEENWPNYFINRDKADFEARVSHKRYGLAKEGTSKNYAWETADPRFDATPYADQPHGGHVNEPHRFGWVVEIDPFDPQAQPIKRTAFGRFSRECAALSLGKDGRMAFYSGDDAKGEYIYKFVPAGRFDAADPKAARNLLDEGTLYVARLNDDGSGQWLALVHGQNGLTAENGFASLEEVLLNARAAADRAGATPMDRPEWAAVHPTTGEVYVTLTNNDGRGDKQPTDKANPRPHNLHGQILRFNEQGADPTATAFAWELFLLAGEARGAKDKDGKAVPANLTGTINGDLFSSPDGLAFDAAGRLWIQTDYDDIEPAMHNMGCNQLLCADPATREVRRFLVGPRGCEITGLAWSPDGKAMWANIQHPGLSFPASDGKTRPRSTTLLITRNDGGVIGS